MTILDYIKEGKLPEVPISFDKESIVYFGLAIFLMGLLLMIIWKLFFSK